MDWMKHNTAKRQLVEIKEDGRVTCDTINDDPVITQQHHADSCDINKIYARFNETGELVHVSRQQGIFADVANIRDLPESMQKVMDANKAFMALPAETRLRFQNDPNQLLQFLQDPSNLDEGIKLGLYEKPLDYGDITKNVKNDDDKTTTINTNTTNNSATASKTKNESSKKTAPE